MKNQVKEHFRRLFEELRSQALLELNDLEELQEKSQSGDEVDLALIERDRALKLKLQGRKSFFLKKLDKALEKIELDEFGTCEDCGSEISLQRLYARPTATLCIHCKEEQESSEKHIPYQKRSHTLGQAIVGNTAHRIEIGERKKSQSLPGPMRI